MLQTECMNVKHININLDVFKISFVYFFLPSFVFLEYTFWLKRIRTKLFIKNKKMCENCENHRSIKESRATVQKYVTNQYSSCKSFFFLCVKNSSFFPFFKLSNDLSCYSGGFHQSVVERCVNN